MWQSSKNSHNKELRKFNSSKILKSCVLWEAIKIEKVSKKVLWEIQKCAWLKILEFVGADSKNLHFFLKSCLCRFTIRKKLRYLRRGSSINDVTSNLEVGSSKRKLIIVSMNWWLKTPWKMVINLVTSFMDEP